MSLFSSILGGAASLIPGIGPIAGPLVSGIAGSIGNSRADDQRQAGAQAAVQATNPVSVTSRTGSSVFNDANNSLTVNPDLWSMLLGNRAKEYGQYALDDLGAFNAQGASDQTYNRLQQLRAPDIAQARSSLQAQLLNRGRLGVGRGGGLTGGLFNPETAAQEEAIARARLSDVDYANQESRRQQNQLLNQAQGLFGIGQGFLSGGQDLAQIGIAARTPGGTAAGLSNAANAQASGTQGFFSNLGTSLGGFFNDSSNSATSPSAQPENNAQFLPRGF